MKTFFKNLKSGLTIGLGFLVMLFIGGTIYASLNNVEQGDTLTAEMWNNNLIPTGATIAFNLSACPSGWLPANGENGTPDLRGKFIRGLNSFENGENELTGTGSDIDGIDRILGSFQDDQMRRITGVVGAIHGGNHSSGVFTFQALTGGVAGTTNTTYVNAKAYFDSSLMGENYKGSDTRPKNIALIYCVKE